MAMRGNSKTFKNYYTANLKGLKEDRHYFEITKYNGETKKSEVVATNQNFIEGNLLWVEKITYKYRNDRGIEEIGRKIQFTISQDDEEVNLQMNYNTVSRTIIYALASAKEIGTINLSLYISKKGNKGCRIKNNWEDLTSSFDYEKDIKGRTEYSAQFKMYDYSKLDAWIDDELIPMINSKLMFKKDKEEIKEEKKEEVLDDLPF